MAFFIDGVDVQRKNGTGKDGKIVSGRQIEVGNEYFLPRLLGGDNFHGNEDVSGRRNEVVISHDVDAQDVFSFRGGREGNGRAAGTSAFFVGIDPLS